MHWCSEIIQRFRVVPDRFLHSSESSIQSYNVPVFLKMTKSCLIDLELRWHRSPLWRCVPGSLQAQLFDDLFPEAEFKVHVAPWTVKTSWPDWAMVLLWVCFSAAKACLLPLLWGLAGVREQHGVTLHQCYRKQGYNHIWLKMAGNYFLVAVSHHSLSA